MNTLLEIREVSRRFTVKKGLFGKDYFYALKRVTLNLRRGEILGVVGESGSGKTTLGRIILRLDRPTEGSVLLESRDVFRMGKEYTRRVSVVFQDPRGSLNPRMRVLEIVEEPLLVHGVEKRRAVAESALERVQLERSLWNRKPDDLSGGQRQRVAIARAVALRPELVVADEPTASLDVSVQREILKLFLSLREEGIAFLFITHDIRIVERIADRVAVIYGGTLMELGRKEEVLQNPLHPYTRFLLSNVPVRHPKMRREEGFAEVEYEIPQEGCPFAPRCAEALQECFRNVRRVELNGRVLSCNLY